MTSAPSKAQPLTAADVETLTGLKRPKWQAFALYFAAGMNRNEAAVAAGYSKGARDHGHKLMRRPEITEAVRIVRAEMAKRAQYDMDKLVADLDEAADFAKQTENATALVRARELKGKALGLLVDRVDARVQQIPFRIEISGIDRAAPAITNEDAP